MGSTESFYYITQGVTYFEHTTKGKGTARELLSHTRGDAHYRVTYYNLRIHRISSHLPLY